MDRRSFMKKAGCATSGIVLSSIGLGANNTPISSHAPEAHETVIREDKDFVDQVTAENTVYVIRNRFNLYGATVKIPANCVLKFEGGNICNGKIIGDNTQIISYRSSIFGLDVSISGNWCVDEIYPEWFGAKRDGKTDDIKAIQKAIDTCSDINDVNTVLFSNGEYLINTPINLNSSESTSRHNICLRGSSMPFTSVKKGARIIGNTGGVMIETIDSVNCIIEKIAIVSNSGSNPSTIGLVVGRGDLQYVPKITVRDAFINIGYNKPASRNNNKGFGSIGILLNDAEESNFDNVEVCANLCVGITHNGKVAKYAADKDGTPTNKIDYTYTPYFKKKLSNQSNTVYRFTNCRFLSKGKISPAVYISSTSDANFTNCFFQTSKWDNNNGNVNYAMLLGALRNSYVKTTLEGYGSAIVCESEISNCEIRIVIDGKDPNGIIHIIEPSLTERNWYNNNISITSNNVDKPLFSLKKNNISGTCLIGLTNNNICSNTKDMIILPAFDILKRDNNLRLSDVSYLEAGRYHGRILNDYPNPISVDESKYYHLWDYVVGNSSADNAGSSCNIIDQVTLLTANTGSPAPSSYFVKIVVEIKNLTSKAEPDFKVNFSFSAIYKDSMYNAHKIEKVEPFVVFDNKRYMVSCFVKIVRKIQTNSMRVTIAQEIEYNGTPVRQGRQIVVGHEIESSLIKYSSKGTLKSEVQTGVVRPFAPIGFCFFDTSLNPARPVWYNGKDWVDANGKEV